VRSIARLARRRPRDAVFVFAHNLRFRRSSSRDVNVSSVSRRHHILAHRLSRVRNAPSRPRSRARLRPRLLASRRVLVRALTTQPPFEFASPRLSRTSAHACAHISHNQRLECFSANLFALCTCSRVHRVVVVVVSRRQFTHS
jgi:hypothetical protein